VYIGDLLLCLPGDLLACAVARLLSVNLIFLDDKDRAVLVRRDRSVSHGGTCAGVANGACVELGGDSLIMNINGVLESPETLEEFISWLRSDPDMAPHAVGGTGAISTGSLETPTP
jgi:hypothetical protein